MKKTIITLLIAFVFALLSIDVNAEKLSIQKTNYYFTRFDPSDGHKTSDYFKLYDINGIISYCIEPDIHEGTTDYRESTWNETELDKKTIDKISLIAYYGYSYPGHETIKYGMATQALIWESILGSDSWVRFNTSLWERGENIDITEERNEILSLINKHRQKPSFANTVKTAYVSDELLLLDNNEVLNQFNISIDGIETSDYTINNNSINLHFNNDGTIVIHMNKKQIYNTRFRIFISDEHQNIYTTGNIDNLYYRTQIDVLPLASLNIHKTTEDNKQVPLINAKYGLFDNHDNLIKELTTNEFGECKTEKILKNGTYYVKELIAPIGYELDTEKHYFSVNRIDREINLFVKDNLIKSNLKIIKVDENNIPITNNTASFKIYDVDLKKYLCYEYMDNSICEYSTNEKGEILIPFKVTYGKYKLIEIKSPVGYEKNEDMEFFIDGVDSEKVIYYENKRINSDIQIKKLSSKDSKPLEGVNISLYDENDNLIINETTDINGVINIDSLEYGKYYIKEESTVQGYKKCDEIIPIVIDGTNKMIEIVITNSPIEATLLIKKTDDNNNPIAGVSFAIYDSHQNLISIENTNEFGIVEVTLPYGDYYFQESFASDKYLISNDKYYFTVDGTKNLYEYNVINVPKTGKNDIKIVFKQFVIIIIGILICGKRFLKVQ